MEDLGINETTLASWVSRAKRAEKATPEDKDALIARLTMGPCGPGRVGVSVRLSSSEAVSAGAPHSERCAGSRPSFRAIENYRYEAITEFFGLPSSGDVG
ncbi:hypothetical protein ACOT81_39585 [Streptomyces sp. WI04-05B]|uniref:hypothetical protein n=1 Tax=Streptomyces TaxID=1883 RepID=UPI0005C9AAA3|nr:MULTISPECIES: hypothetical protein [Streptomyces]MDX2548237.1 hypothetical protein [Streptomyces sp. WI04-05B]MDX2590274.1 hypothetical protein [Streptomyces sp. WI04-05A]MDX3500262.1 hypothetical protein [Streptomyces turgidiscabies]